MNLPNKLTIARIVMTLFIIIILIFPFDAAGIELPKLFINESIIVDIKYFITILKLCQLKSSYIKRYSCFLILFKSFYEIIYFINKLIVIFSFYHH